MTKRRKSRLVAMLMGLLLLAGCSAAMKADYKVSMGQYEEAIVLYEQHLAASPDDARARKGLGYAYLQADRADKAVVELEKARELDPGEPEAALYLGLAYIKTEKLEKAIAAWQGFEYKKKPLVEQEIKRQLEMLLIEVSRQQAREALANEKQLATRKPEPNTVAVCYYKDLSPKKEFGPFQKALAAMVITDLSKIESVKVIERVRLQELLAEMKLGQTGIVDPKSAPRIGHLLGVENVLVGNLSKGSINTVNTLTGTGKAGSFSVKTPDDEFFNLSGEIALNAAKAAGIPATDAEKQSIVPQTRSREAVELLGKALIEKDRRNYDEAKRLLEEALRKDPRFELAKVERDRMPSAAPGRKQMYGTSAKQLSEAEDAQKEADRQAEAMGGGSGDGSSGGGSGGGSGGHG
jgi:tetratricopeptide (TPR) repeat protein